MVTPSFCIDRLELLKSRFHGKQRTKLRENINKAVRIRERMVLEGKLYKYNKSVLREHPTFNFLSSIILATGEILENPFEIPLQHRGGIHAEGPEGWNWETDGTKEEFLVATKQMK